MRATFTGFDSAWGARNTGALCELLLRDDGALLLQQGEPSSATWDYAVGRAGRKIDSALSVWAIDQPICVANESGQRPVEKDLARALMADFSCGAHSSNLSNPCWSAGARIWDLVRTLAENGYHHNPTAVPSVTEGRYYFECYPHPAILGLFELDCILKYKVRKGDGESWQRLLQFLRELDSAELPIVNIGGFVTNSLTQNLDNENKLDAIISAYVAAYWWKFGTERSTMIGDTTTGYIVTPHSDRTRLALAEVFRERRNMSGPACAPPPAGKQPASVAMPKTGWTPPARQPVADRMPAEPADEWVGPVKLIATDTTNLWRTSKKSVINPWMDASRMEQWRLWVRFLEEDGEPSVLFVPFENQGRQQGGMRSADQQMNRTLWQVLVADAKSINPLDFQILYRYEQI